MFLAVAAALAADSWRTTLSEKRETGPLINSLLADLDIGVDQLEQDRNRTARVLPVYPVDQVLWASTPQAVNERFHRATGIPPITVADIGELPHEPSKQAPESIANNPEVLEDLRERHAMLSIFILPDVFQRAIDSSYALSTRLEAVSC